MKNISRQFFWRGSLLIVAFLLTGCTPAWLNLAGNIDNTLFFELLVSGREIDVAAFDHNPFTKQVYFIGFPRRYYANGSLPRSTATLYRLDLRTGRRVEVYRNFAVESKNLFLAALRDGGVMILRGGDDYRFLREEADYSLLTFHHDTLSHRLDVIRGSDLAEREFSYPLEKRANDLKYELPIERNCRALVQQSSLITPIGQVVFRVGDEYKVIPRFIAMTRQSSEQQAALDVLRCGGYDFYTEFAHRITGQSDTLWNPDAHGDTHLYTPRGRLRYSADFQIPDRQFRIREVSPTSLALNRLYHEADCEQYVKQIFYRGETYQTGTCARVELPTSHYLFTGDEFLLLLRDGIMKGRIP